MKRVDPARNPTLVAVHAALPSLFKEVCSVLTNLDDGQAADPNIDLGMPHILVSLRVGHNDTVSTAAYLLSTGCAFENPSRWMLTGNIAHLSFPTRFVFAEAGRSYGAVEPLIVFDLGYHPMRSIAERWAAGDIDIVDLVQVARYVDGHVAADADNDVVSFIPAWDYPDAGRLFNRLVEALDEAYADDETVGAARSAMFRELVAQYGDQWPYHLTGIDQVVQAAGDAALDAS